MTYLRPPTTIIDDLNQPMNSAVNALKRDKYFKDMQKMQSGDYDFQSEYLCNPVTPSPADKLAEGYNEMCHDLGHRQTMVRLYAIAKDMRISRRDVNEALERRSH